MDYYSTAGFAKMQAAQMRRRAAANRRELSDPKSPFGSDYMADIYDASAEIWVERATGIESHIPCEQ